jgi:hypothetical protein
MLWSPPYSQNKTWLINSTIICWQLEIMIVCSHFQKYLLILVQQMIYCLRHAYKSSAEYNYISMNDILFKTCIQVFHSHKQTTLKPEWGIGSPDDIMTKLRKPYQLLISYVQLVNRFLVVEAWEARKQHSRHYWVFLLHEKVVTSGNSVLMSCLAIIAGLRLANHH